MGEHRIALILLLIFCVALVAFPNVEIVKAEGTIYIRADGSVEGTDKIQRNGDIYTLTGNISGEIHIQKSNILLDGAGYQIQGNGIENGITISEINNITVKNFGLYNFNIGIVVMGSHNNTILDNTITDNFRGLDFTSSQSNIISGNYIADNTDGIAIENMYNSVVQNTITNNSDDGIFLYGAGFNNVIGNNITNNNSGIKISICYNNIIYHNNFINNIMHVKTDSSISIWDNSEEGNYWDNYTSSDNDVDGIGDTVYVISENNHDNFPLVNIIPEFPSFLHLLIILIGVATVATAYRHKLNNRERRSQ